MRHKWMVSLLGVWAMALAGCAHDISVDSPLIARRASCIKIDGRLIENAWKQAVFVGLEGYSPEQAASNHIARQTQIASPIRAALLWDDAGLYVGMEISDEDVQADKTRNNDWIWLEDAGELFLVKNRSGQVPHLELQVSPIGTRYEKLMQGQTYKTISSVQLPYAIPQYQVAVHVDGSLNDSEHKDNGWSIEWFISWDQMHRSDLLADGVIPKTGQMACYARLADWNISIYSNYRVVRYLLPGSADPHVVRTYRPVLLAE